MNLAITVPQIFYDIIARVLPGFFFLLFIKIVFIGTNGDVALFGNDNSANFATSLRDGIGYFFLFYLFGWVLHSLTYKSHRKKIRKEHNEKLRKNEKNSITIRSMFQELRIINPEAGFRVVKLRAEARMIEATRTGTGILILISALAVILDIFKVHTFSEFIKIELLLKISILIIVYFSLRHIERSRWHRYYDNIPAIYNIVCPKNDKKVTTFNDRRQTDRRKSDRRAAP